MTNDEVIAKLTRDNLELKETLNDYEQALKDIQIRLYAIGAPLNDNYFKYNKEQLRIFFHIADICKSVI